MMQPLPAGPPPLPKELSREQAIRALKAHLLKLTDDETSLCQVASQRGIFCKGFRGLSDEEFKKRYHTLVARRPGLTRRQYEYLANQWQLARQVVDGVKCACDAQAKEHDTCGGWDDFTNEDLVRFCRELFAAEVTLVPAPPA
jgi:hypothetical protein